MVVSYSKTMYILEIKVITNSPLQLNQTVPIQMKTRILHGNEAKSTQGYLDLSSDRDVPFYPKD